MSAPILGYSGSARRPAAGTRASAARTRSDCREGNLRAMANDRPDSWSRKGDLARGAPGAPPRRDEHAVRVDVLRQQREARGASREGDGVRLKVRMGRAERVGD